MHAIADFIPAYCPNCGHFLGKIDPIDWIGGSIFICNFCETEISKKEDRIEVKSKGHAKEYLRSK